MSANLTACPDCRGQVSRSAASCPHCGRKLRETASDGLYRAFVLLLAVIVVPFFLLMVGFLFFTIIGVN